MSLGSGRIALLHPPASSAEQTSIGLSALPGLSGWWDAGTWNGLTSVAGEASTGWNQPVGGLIDRSGNANAMAPYSFATPTRAPYGQPRLSGTLGGVGRLASAANAVTPPLDPDLGFQVPGDVVDWGYAWTWYFVWSRHRPSNVAIHRDDALVAGRWPGRRQSTCALSRHGANCHCTYFGPQTYPFHRTAIGCWRWCRCLARRSPGRDRSAAPPNTLRHPTHTISSRRDSARCGPMLVP